MENQIRKSNLEKYKKELEIIDEFTKTTDFEVFDYGEKIELTDDIFFFKSKYNTKVEQFALENHHYMIDVHYAYIGNEAINMCLTTELELTDKYDESSDFEWYRPLETSKIEKYFVNEGSYLVIFPGEAHEPEIKIDTDVNTKIVFKVKYNK